MKKSLLSICGAFAVSAFMAQTVSPSWQTLQNTSYTMTSATSKFMDVVSSNVVWGVGYSGAGVTGNFCDFTRTTNGGVTFTGGTIYPDTDTYVIANLDAIDANTAWVSAYLKVSQAQGAIHKTTNGGVTWTNMTPANMFTNTASFADVIAFTTPSVGVVIGDPHPGIGNEFEIWTTADGGTTWSIVSGTNIPNPTTGEYGLVNIYEKYGANNVWFGTNKGRIFRSTNAGATWSVSVLPGTPTASLSVNDIAFSSPLKGIAAVYNASVTPQVFEEYITSDGGATWTKVANIDPKFGRNDVCGIPGTGVFASAANSATSTALSYSKDGGITWTDWGSSGIPYLNIDFADATAGWASTFQSAPSTGGIYKFNGPTSIFSLGTNSICLSGSSATVVANNMSLGNAPTTYSWSAGSGVAFSSPTATNPVITFTTNGNYVISLTATNATTTHVSTVNVSVISCITPTAAFTIAASTCTGVVVTPTNSSTGAVSYVWSTTPAAFSINTNTSTAPGITFSSPNTYTVKLVASSATATTSVTHTITVVSCVGIAENTLLSSNMHVYPNPAKDVLNIEVTTTENYSVTLSNLLGKVIISDKSSKEKASINLNTVAPGIYFLTIDVKGEKATKKIIVE